MSEQNEKLTADQYFDKHFVKFKGKRECFISEGDFLQYAQQVKHATAELRKELEAWGSMHNAQMAESKWLKSENLDKDGVIETLKTQLVEAERQREEAVDVANELLEQLRYVQKHFVQTGSTAGVITQCEVKLSSLSSGETNR